MGFGFLEPDQARELIAQGQAGVVVVGDPGSFEAGHIGGAISLGEHNVGAFVSESDKAVYTLDSPDKVQEHVGHKVTLEGTMDGTTIAVASVTM